MSEKRLTHSVRFQYPEGEKALRFTRSEEQAKELADELNRTGMWFVEVRELRYDAYSKFGDES